MKRGSFEKRRAFDVQMAIARHEDEAGIRRRRKRQLTDGRWVVEHRVVAGKGQLVWRVDVWCASEAMADSVLAGGVR